MHKYCLKFAIVRRESSKGFSMGKLINGEWVKKSIITSDNSGAYARLPRTFLDVISNEHPVFKPETGRYHLYVSLACPWASRTLIYRELKDLQNHISLDIVHPDMMENGWTFDTSFPAATIDSLYDYKFLRQIYTKADPLITTSVTVPVLWDKKTETIVNNESSEIIRIMNSGFNNLTGNNDNYYPEELSSKIDDLNKIIYSSVNNGVYICGYAKSQQSYEQSARRLFKTLDDLDLILGKTKFLLGKTLTEADLRLIPTLLRFDEVYYTHFKCNFKRICDYKNLMRYTEDLYSIPAIKKTTNFEHIKRHYYYSHETLNPYRLIPIGPKRLLR